MKAELNTFVRRCRKLPSLPALYYQLVAAIDNPESSLDVISDIVRMDPSLASRLLRLANSAFYGFPAEIGTLSEAVRLIGLRQIHEVALATTIIKEFENLPSNLVDVASFWEHSVACAIACSLLATAHNERLPERFFIAGLLHDIGRLVAMLNAPNESKAILEKCEQKAELCFRVENEILGFDHATLGAELLSFWNLPHSLREMVRNHHQPAEASVFSRDAFLVHYADFITTTMEFGNSGERFVCPLKVPAHCESYLLESAQLDWFVEELELKCADINPLLVSSAN